MVIDAIISALVNLFILAGFPFLIYYCYQKLRHKRSLGEVACRAGIQSGGGRYLCWCVGLAGLAVAAILIWRPPMEPMIREGSAWRNFVGLGLSGSSLVMSLSYGVIKTGFAEELLFRGLIGGSLSRRMSAKWANILQALIFLLPHLLLLKVMPEVWPLLLVIFFFSLLMGWIRIKSGSFFGPWIVHASVNITMSLSVVIRTAA